MTKDEVANQKSASAIDNNNSAGGSSQRNKSPLSASSPLYYRPSATSETSKEQKEVEKNTNMDDDPQVKEATSAQPAISFNEKAGRQDTNRNSGNGTNSDDAIVPRADGSKDTSHKVETDQIRAKLESPDHQQTTGSPNSHSTANSKPATERRQSTGSRKPHLPHHGNRSNRLNSKSNVQQQQAAPQPQQQLATSCDQQVPCSAEYLAQLIKDKKQLSLFPSAFIHVQRLIDEEINKVRQSLFQLNDVVHSAGEPLELPEPEGDYVQLQEKIYVPVGEHPEYNFVGRLLGPRGMTAKQLEQETGCKIMIRGRGSMRDKKKEEQNRGKANWEHLNDELHVLITVEDTQNRAQVKLERALEEVRQLLVPIVDGEDELKKRQLMELAIINGTYRDCNYNETLSKMLNDVVYRGANAGATSGSQSDPTPQTQLALMNGASPQPSTPGRHYAGNQQQLHHPQHYLNGSSLSSGIASTGSNTPNSIHGPPMQQKHHHSQHHMHQQAQQQQQHPTSAGLHMGQSAATAAVVAAAAAAAASQQQQQHPHTISPMHPPPHHLLVGPPPHHPHPHPHLHPHAQSPAVAAAAAATAALMANHQEAGAMMFAQQYHDFHHYAAMAAAAAAASQQQQPPPPPTLLGAADYHAHPHSHSHHQQQQQQQQAAAAAVAQAVAAAAAAAQLHHFQPSPHPHSVSYQPPHSQHSSGAPTNEQLVGTSTSTATSSSTNENGNDMHMLDDQGQGLMNDQSSISNIELESVEQNGRQQQQQQQQVTPAPEAAQQHQATAQVCE